MLVHKKSDKVKRLVALLSIILVVPTISASAMHIMEGYIPAAHCVLWGIVCVPFLIAGGMSMKKQISADGRVKLLLALSGAFVFVISSLKIPSVTGSCSHPTGTGLGAVLFGPSVMSVLGIIVLIFQALLLAHGGITNLGANTFSMAIAGPFLSYGIFALLKKTKAPLGLNVFLATTLGDLFTYCVTSFQLAFAFSGEGFGYSMLKFMSIFAPTQLPIAVAEGLLSVIIFNVLNANCQKELRALKVI